MESQRVPLNPHDSELSSEVKINEVARIYSTAFETAFIEDVLPKETTWVFDSSDKAARLYCDKRELLIDNNEDNQEPSELSSFDNSYPYEKYLENLFWKKRDEESNPVVILVGEVGSGKSTFIKYFLRCYCPAGKLEEFNKKIPVIVNLSTVTDENFETEFYEKIRKSIQTFVANHEQTKGKSLDEFHNYQMYDPILDYRGDTWKRTVGDQDENDIRAQHASNIRTYLHFDDKRWVNLALLYLSTEIRNKEEREKEQEPREWPIFRYLVICLDDIDQRPISVQQKVLQVVKKWVTENDHEFWQIYIPLWPKTFKNLIENHTNSSIGSYQVVKLGQVSPECIREKRNNILKELITGTMTEITDSSRVFNDESREKGLRYLDDVLLSSKRQDFISNIQKLSGGNLRIERQYWIQILSNFGLFKRFDQNKSLGYYDHWNSAITGDRVLHHRRDSKIKNIFYCVDPINNPRSLLVGPHLLFVLNHLRISCNSDEIETQKVYENMNGLGYEDNLISTAFSYLKESIYHTYNDNMEEQGIIRLIPDALNQYHMLLSNEAYLDNMAMVTPVNKQYCKNMSVTDFYDPASIFKRAITTINFLNQIKEDEAFFCDTTNLNKVQSAEFIKNVEKIRISWIFNSAANAYKARLNALRKDLRLIDPQKWNELLEHKIFEGVSDQPKLLRIDVKPIRQN